MANIGIKLTLSVLDADENSRWSWDAPKVDKFFDFEVPEAMFDSSVFSKMIKDSVTELKKGLPEAKEAWRIEHEKRDAEYARQKAEREASKVE